MTASVVTVSIGPLTSIRDDSALFTAVADAPLLLLVVVITGALMSVIG